MSHIPTYRHLNLERVWPLFERQGVEIHADGALRLARLPDLEVVGEPLPPVPGLEGPVGIGADDCGNVYIADPAGHQILRLGPCEDQPTPLRCVRGPGVGRGLLHSPRGVAVDRRGRLLIADSRNGRIVLIDLETEQPLGYWDGRGPDGRGAPFGEPWDLAVDECGEIYVADPGRPGRRGGREGGALRRFGAGGMEDREFASTLSSQDVRPLAPIGVAVGAFAGEAGERLVVLDSRRSRLLVFHMDGRYDPEATHRWARAVGAAAGAAGSVALAGGILYLTNPGGGRVLLFDAEGAFLGAVAEGAGHVAGIGVDCRGRLLVHPGGGAAIRRARGEPVFASCGTFLAGPFRATTDPTRWQRIRMDLERLPEGAHFRLYTLTSDALDGSPGNRPAIPVDCTGNPVVPAASADEELTPLDSWRAAPRDADALLALNRPGEFLWIAGLLQGDGSVTPTLRQIRLHHDEEGWLRWLPALYRRRSESHPFLERALALFETALDEAEAHIEALPRLFDAWAAPDAPSAPWLAWLASWVDAPLDDRWPEPVRRGVVATAFDAHARRGTRASLRRLIRLHTGATAVIDEALPDPPTWSLGEVSALGFQTRLAPEPAEGAVLDRTAIVDHSRIAEPGRYGPPLFEDAAHRFHVAVLTAGNARETLERVRRVIDREKPAHTTYALCAVGAKLRVGFQARLGIDAIVGGAEPPSARLDGHTQLGRDTTLGGTLTHRGARIGQDARVGSLTTLVR